MQLTRQEHKQKENTRIFLNSLDEQDRHILKQAVNDMLKPMNKADFGFYCFQLAESMPSIDQWLLDSNYLYYKFLER